MPYVTSFTLVWIKILRNSMDGYSVSFVTSFTLVWIKIIQ